MIQENYREKVANFDEQY
jgi:ABC-type multidrug transport system permease subunit